MPAGPAPRGSGSSWPGKDGGLGGSLAALAALAARAAASAPWPLIAASLALLFIHDLGRHPGPTLALLGAAFIALPFAVRRLAAGPAPTLRAFLLTTALLRLPLLLVPPTLSDDALRYLWDGKVAAAGQNPYVLAPAAEALAPLRDESWARLPHREVETVYPPLAMAAFSIASRFPFPLLVWKLLAAAADLLACGLLYRLAGRCGLPVARAAWYAWNPLVTLEVAGMGHVDALGVAATLAVLLCLAPAAGAADSADSAATRHPSGGMPGRTRGAVQAACWAAAGALAKLVPLIAFPAWARRSGRPWLFAAGALTLFGIAMAPILASTGGLPPGLARYGISWEYNGPLFEPLWRLLDRVHAAPALAQLVDRLKDWTHDYRSWNVVYPYLYPQLLAKALLAAGIGVAVLLSLRDADPVHGTGRLLGRVLLCSATVYPWYLLWMLPMAALRRSVPWLVLSGLIVLSYLPKIAGIPLLPWVYLAIWGPFAGLLVWEKLKTPSPGVRA